MGNPSYIEGANISFDGSIDGDKPPETLDGRPEGIVVQTNTRTLNTKQDDDGGRRGSKRSNDGNTSNIEEEVVGTWNCDHHSDPSPPPPPSRQQQSEKNQSTLESTAVVKLANTMTNAEGTTSQDRDKEQQDKSKDTADRLPLPVGFQQFENKQNAAEQQEKGPGAIKKVRKPAAKETPEDHKSTTSSTKLLKRSSKGISKVSSVLAEQVDKQMRENLALEELRNEENKAHMDAELAELYRRNRDIEMQKKIGEQLHEKKKEKIKEVAAKLHTIIDDAEEGNKSETSSVIALGEDSQEDWMNLEMTAAGARYGGVKPDALTSDWAKGAAKMMSKRKKI